MSKPLGFRTANRRYKLVFWPLIALYVLLLIGGAFIIDKETSSVFVRASFAFAIALPLFGVLWAMLRLVRETDEYTRMRQLKALAEGGALTTGTIFLCGFLELFDVVGDIPLFLFGPLFFLAFGLAHCRAILGRTV